MLWCFFVAVYATTEYKTAQHSDQKYHEDTIKSTQSPLFTQQYSRLLFLQNNK